MTPETDSSPLQINGWLEDEFPFEKAYFQSENVSFREGKSFRVFVYCQGEMFTRPGILVDAFPSHFGEHGVVVIGFHL